MLPGWRVDDFLDSPSAPIDSYCKVCRTLLDFLPSDTLEFHECPLTFLNGSFLQTEDSDHGNITSRDSRRILDVSAQSAYLPLSQSECDLLTGMNASEKDDSTQNHKIESEVYAVPDVSSKPLKKSRHVCCGF